MQDEARSTCWAQDRLELIVIYRCLKDLLLSGKPRILSGSSLTRHGLCAVSVSLRLCVSASLCLCVSVSLRLCVEVCAASSKHRGTETRSKHGDPTLAVVEPPLSHRVANDLRSTSEL
jgi:hypothetical protein